MPAPERPASRPQRSGTSQSVDDIGSEPAQIKSESPQRPIEPPARPTNRPNRPQRQPTKSSESSSDVSSVLQHDTDEFVSDSPSVKSRTSSIRGNVQDLNDDAKVSIVDADSVSDQQATKNPSKDDTTQINQDIREDIISLEGKESDAVIDSVLKEKIHQFSGAVEPEIASSNSVPARVTPIDEFDFETVESQSFEINPAASDPEVQPSINQQGVSKERISSEALERELNGQQVVDREPRVQELDVSNRKVNLQESCATDTKSESQQPNVDDNEPKSDKLKIQEAQSEVKPEGRIKQESQASQPDKQVFVDQVPDEQKPDVQKPDVQKPDVQKSGEQESDKPKTGEQGDCESEPRAELQTVHGVLEPQLQAEDQKYQAKSEDLDQASNLQIEKNTVKTPVQPDIDSSEVLRPVKASPIEDNSKDTSKPDKVGYDSDVEIDPTEPKTPSESKTPENDQVPIEPKRATVSELAQRFTSAAAAKPPPERPARRPMRRITDNNIEATKVDKPVLEKETPKVPTKPKPQVSSRIGQLKSSIFADLNAALSKGPPGRRSSKATSECDEGSEPTPSLPEEDADIQLKSMAPTPRSRPRGPKRRLPDAAKAKWSTTTSHLWSINHVHDDAEPRELILQEAEDYVDPIGESSAVLDSIEFKQTNLALKEAEDYADPAEEKDEAGADASELIQSAVTLSGEDSCNPTLEETEEWGDTVKHEETTQSEPHGSVLNEVKASVQSSNPVGPDTLSPSKADSEESDSVLHGTEKDAGLIESNESTDSKADFVEVSPINPVNKLTSEVGMSSNSAPLGDTDDEDHIMKSESSYEFSESVSTKSESSQLQNNDVTESRIPPARPNSRPTRIGVDELDARSEDLQKRLAAAKEKIRQARERKAASGEPKE